MPTAAKFIAAAKTFTGVPYVYGGKTETSLDCSGLITLSLNVIDVPFPHGSANQIAATTPITVAMALETPGALLYRPGHIAISLGDGTTFEARSQAYPVGVHKNASARGWTQAGLIDALTYDNQTDSNSSTTSGTKMISPVQGRVTSEFSPSRKNPVTGKVESHLGIDIAAKEGTPIYAPFAGTVIGVGANLVKGRTGTENVLIENPDGEKQYFGHCHTALVKKGQKVKAGDKIATVGQRGNATGPHLHFETWNKSGKAVNPRLYFTYHGIAPGSTPKLPAKPSTPSTPSAPSKSKSNPKVLAYQKRQNKYGKAGLDEDGINGPKTKAWKAWVEKLQKSLRSWKGVASNLAADGDYGVVTHESVKTVQRRNGLDVDGFAQDKTIKFMRSQGSTVPYRP